jgi:hypothetical protein
MMKNSPKRCARFRDKLYMKYGVYEFDKGDFNKYEFQGLLATIG